MSDELDLGPIEARAAEWDQARRSGPQVALLMAYMQSAIDAPDLVAEVRRLRAERDRLRSLAAELEAELARLVGAQRIVTNDTGILGYEMVGPPTADEVAHDIPEATFDRLPRNAPNEGVTDSIQSGADRRRPDVRCRHGYSAGRLECPLCWDDGP